MQTFHQFIFSEATPPPGKPPATGAAPIGAGPSAPPMGAPMGGPSPSGPPIGLGGGGPPPPMGGPSLSSSMGAGPDQGQNPNAPVTIQKLSSKDVWEALEKSLKSFKSRQGKKNSI